ncbi:MAG: hypothetical protein JKX84_02405 [Flavobacteriales bacterium]|nr:hypothetical protein [Flavobacteriales bacterium]
MGDFMTNYGIVIAYILFAVALAAAIIFPVIQLARNPKNAKGALVGVVALVVVVGIAYALSSGDNPSKIEISTETAKQVDTGLFAFYILGGIAVASLVYSEVARVFK